MASSSRGLQTVLQVVLGIAIVVLSYFLYVSITEPYDRVERMKQVTEDTRERMRDVRAALVAYERQNGRYTTSLDSLVMWIRTDSVMSAQADSLFGADLPAIDSLIFSPRTGHMFSLAVNDTSRVSTYLLSDPDSDDAIGTISGDVTRLNAANWE